VEAAEVVRLVQAVLDAGVDCVSVADTVGYADPAMVSSLFEQVLQVAGDRLTCAHFHDTRGLGLANVYAALQLGITRFDACSGGIGGCPHAPGASGNVATEDLAYLFASMGVATGLDFDRLIALRGKIAHWLEGEPLHGSVWRAGLPKTMKNQEPRHA
jgi:hydroxymethylglutaryl-CoA lyase